ncbi:L-gulonolactone oxidase isoform X2 [Chiloscyllium plagiosum]|uniref:L-gulonolactone oxidase isoform X2 n=1 Tax=Chiloscyllium plagiosum TaxID=36176 RepID=UPI001CB863DB|nr:L-gulonolactone oxidase isoform X2 [Chiloscyllium plagiosum]
MIQGTVGYQFQNWANTYSCKPEFYFEPASVEEVRQVLELAKQRNKRVKIVGCGHSPSDIACTDDYLIRLNKLNRLLQVDTKKKQVMVEAGMVLADLNEELAKLGLALSNIGAVSDVTVGGVIGTGTHNTGIQHGILATQVVAITLLTAAGDMLECSDTVNHEIFQAVRLHLGALGVVLNVTIQCVPAFRIHLQQFPKTLTEVLNDLDTHLKQSEYFRLFWFPHTDKVTVSYADPTDKPVKTSSSWLWNYAIGYYLLEFLLWVSTFFPCLVPWINRFYFWLVYSAKIEQVKRSDKAFNFDCLFKQHVSDWSIPIMQIRPALEQLKNWLDSNPNVQAHFPVEVRFARADDILLSPCYKQDSCFINIIMYRPYGKEVPREQYWAMYEEIMKRNGGRPHWAKAHSCLRQDFEKMYPAFHKFCSIREELDPSGMFLNNYLEKTFF